ncbi:GNAT family N-acetyltransferase [Amycolatopsis sp. cg9]|uniref:GNAT family N-acetyltransferase n=1 Tax=Amycolatopsis sp. cg9 TaxID=3238801 RepID=UPI003523A99D
MSDPVVSRWVDSADAVPAELFDGPYFSMTVGWARAWEKVRTEQVRAFRHLTLEGGPAAELVPYYLVDHSPTWRGYEDEAEIPPVWTGPVVYSSTLYGEHGGAGGSSPEYIARAIDLGLEQTRAWGAEALVFGNLTPDAVDAWGAVRPFDAAVLLDKKYESPLGDEGAGFLGGMRGKVRRELLRQWRRGVESGLRLRALTGDEMLPHLEDFTELAVDTSVAHGDELYGPDIFHSLTSVPGAVLLVAEHEGRMAGAFYCFLYRGRLALTMAGLDYDKLGELNTYAFLMYESVRYALANGAAVLDPGRCNFEYKQRHGFRGTELRAVVYLPEPRPDLVAALERMDGLMHEYIAGKVAAA